MSASPSAPAGTSSHSPQLEAGASSSSASATSSLSLVRRLPPIIRGWTGLKLIKKKFLIKSTYQKHWAEVRGSSLLLFAASDVIEGPTPDEVNVNDVKTENVKLIQLKNTEITINTKKFSIKIIDPVKGFSEMRFRSMEEAKDWFEKLQYAADSRVVGLGDFQVLACVGEGASGKVFRVRDVLTDEILALKVLDKNKVYRDEEAYRQALEERLIMELACDHPFILEMLHAFQTNRRLYLVTEFCGAGDLLDYLNWRRRPLSENQAKRMSGEILLALEHIHNMGIVYRDMKLENVLLDEHGHIRVGDFGLSKLLQGETQDKKTLKRTNTFCGTREYVAPEMLLGEGYDGSIDIWAFGVLLYEIICGSSPFAAQDLSDEEEEAIDDFVYGRIESGEVEYPDFLSNKVVSLLKGLLEKNPSKRLTIPQIKAHPWYADVNWEGLYNKEDHPDNIKVPASARRQDGDGIEYVVLEDDENDVELNTWKLPPVALRKKGIMGFSFSSCSSRGGSRRNSRDGRNNMSGELNKMTSADSFSLSAIQDKIKDIDKLNSISLPAPENEPDLA